mgnify:CR=1 FL=1
MENYKFAILMSPIYTKFKKVQHRFIYGFGFLLILFQI